MQCPHQPHSLLHSAQFWSSNIFIICPVFVLTFVLEWQLWPLLQGSLLFFVFVPSATKEMGGLLPSVTTCSTSRGPGVKADSIDEPPPSKGMNYMVLAELVARWGKEILRHGRPPGFVRTALPSAGQGVALVLVLESWWYDVWRHVGAEPYCGYLQSACHRGIARSLRA